MTRTSRLGTTVTHLGLIVWAVGSVLPMVYMLSASFQPTEDIYAGISLWPGRWTFDNYRESWQGADFGVYLGNSVLYTTVTTAAVLVFGAGAAYAFARLRFPGRELIYTALLVFLFLPIPGVFIPLYTVLVSLNLADTRIGYVLPLINASLPVAVFIMRRFFEQLPEEIDDAARMDGAGPVTIFWRIAVPLARPALATVAILTVLNSWNEFVLALIVFSDESLMPLQVGLQTFQGTYFAQYGLMMAALTVSTVPVVIVYLLFQRNIIKGITAGAVKG
ncbi:carbohydrate ABC transporter permease [Jiangella sp. DSM 45060]|uniref:carbohydrate ABC transporter permease n=1 Tax=Jiangella sp. DSM 45060 TaxID=1798224 RepID=UPI00087CDAF7|nr:carbohydrate ABC transporter permease [Jiangella sp. DSM 45060]SDS33960.1 carbohydrate ABC transporter membrane protein 2, CUT1 family [Jiangella sp. DSM 45060]